VPSAEFVDTENLVRVGPFLVDSSSQGFWNAAMYLTPVFLLLLFSGLALIIRADWREALWRRFAGRRRGESNLPARL